MPHSHAPEGCVCGEGGGEQYQYLVSHLTVYKYKIPIYLIRITILEYQQYNSSLIFNCKRPIVHSTHNSSSSIQSAGLCTVSDVTGNAWKGKLSKPILEYFTRSCPLAVWRTRVSGWYSCNSSYIPYREECLSSSNSHAHGIPIEQDVTSLHMHGNLTHALPIMDSCTRNGPSSSNSHTHRISCAWVVT